MIAASLTVDGLDIALLAAGCLLLAVYGYLVTRGRDLLHFGPEPDARFGIADAALFFIVGFFLHLTVGGVAVKYLPDDPGDPYLLSYVGPILVAGFALRFLIARNPSHGPRAKGALAGVLTWLAWFPVVFAVFTATRLLWDAAGWEWQDQKVLEDLRAAAAWKFFVTAVILAPIYEEVIFRGLFYAALRRHLPRAGSILICAAAFALVHMSPAQMPALFVLGLALAWIYERTGTLAAPIAFHAVFNGFTFLSEMVKG